MQNKITELENKLNEFKLELEELKKPKTNGRWKPQKGEKYYYINSAGVVYLGDFDEQFTGHRFHYESNNCFRTKEQADQHLENIKTKNELQALADELNGDEFIDWAEINQQKCSLSFICGKGLTSSVSLDFRTKCQGNIYCLDKNFLGKAIERIGEDRLIEMIKAGV